ncbi:MULTISPECIES: N-acetylglucosamine-6-phosphate deacetylase [unclassified Shewanella]|uniref:N-acetylglucosamine-6-phosphate deacetylase n=1 Tax=unclassified Shewanella TaxID=196818 RepID=UPI000C8413E7|nr:MULTISPECIES: N-acetylglucosamine-6-phosphate deacetylase [unclassified Shewanella]MDO6638712.1 N-acetylglucosamine-6-phosphate deacetylase [Shewanella sp. 5_MG-2023]MDO6773730.1 N-acetylglucosamine-6-phosphate deacetylase [Shewanella sp. 3_MG-2023]PMG39679.1 N-acetylglucosamine-6-phosphate deacetylase [Shewanella sp. 10N.286.52.B9]
MRQTLIADGFFDGQQFHQDAVISIEDGHIIALDSVSNAKEVRLQGTLVPGFVDVQVNGGGGALFNSAPTLDCIETIGRAHAQFGTTGFLPTLITDKVEVMAQAADAVAEAIKLQSAGVLGIHFEGPHLSVPKKGVHPQSFIRSISDEELAIFSRQDLGIKVVTLAPENVSVEVIKTLIANDVKVCLGHSNADYDTVLAALNAGANGFTHLFNAMSGFGSREPGMVGAALESDAAWCGLIVDGHHVHSATAKVALKAKPQGKIMLVTDAMPPVGLDDDASFELFGTEVIRQGDRLNAKSGELAGCVLDMVGAVNNTVSMLGLSYEEALRMASLYPAQYLQQAKLGTIAVGQRADLVLLAANANDNSRYQVNQTYINGDVVFSRCDKG